MNYYTPQPTRPKPLSSAFHPSTEYIPKHSTKYSLNQPIIPPSTPIKHSTPNSSHYYTLQPIFITLENINNLHSFLHSLKTHQSNTITSHQPHISTFHLHSLLGSGIHGKVFHYSKHDIHYAIKISHTPFSGPKDASAKLHEVLLLLLLNNSSHVIHLHHSWIQLGILYQQFDLCKYNLQSYLLQHSLQEVQIFNILYQIASGLLDIHSLDIVHLDIKPANIFISLQNTLLIGDFGLASKLPVLNSEEREGDRTYLAPEIWTLVDVGKPADIFSLGLICLEMICNIYLPENGPCWSQLREANYSSIDFGNTSVALVDLVKSMINPTPNNRPTAWDILEHPLVKMHRQ